METAYVKKKWQNLLQNKCVKCDADLVQHVDKKHILHCVNTEAYTCDFFISRRKIFDILADDRHIMRLFLTREERESLQKKIDEAYDAMYI